MLVASLWTLATLTVPATGIHRVKGHMAMYYSPNNNFNCLIIVLQTLIIVVIILKLPKAVLF